MPFGISALIPAFAIIIYSVLLIIVTLSRPLTPSKAAFRVYLASMFIWSVTAIFVVVVEGDNTIWFRVMTASVMGVPMAVLHFVKVSLSRHRGWARWYYFYGIVMMLVCIFTDLVVKYSFVDATGINYEFSFLIFIAGPAGYAVYVFCIFDLKNAFRQTDDAAQRNRLQYLMVGLTIISLAMLVNWTPLGKYPIDIAGNIGAALVITYAVLRHQLLDIEVVIRKSLIYFIPTTIIGASYFLIITLVIRVFEAFSGAEILFTSMIVAILSAIIVQPLRDKAQAWVDKLFFREKYDSNLMIQRVSKTAASFLEINTLANMILDEIISTLHIEKAAFLLKDNPSNEYRLVTHRNLGMNANIRLRPNHPLTVQLEMTEVAITKRDLKNLPQFTLLDSHDREIIDEIGAELIIPLKVQGHLIGILAVGEKRSEQPYSQDDQSTVITLANQTAVAIENARLYTVEQSRRKEMDSLYSLSRELVATDAMMTVLNKVVEHALESIHVTFARILLQDENWSYVCRAIHPVSGLDFDLRLGQKDPERLYHYYEQTLTSDQPLVLDCNKLTLTLEERSALYFDHVQSLCLCPLKIGEESIGILILGERRHTYREPFDPDKLRLATSIADQAANAIQRARLHEQLEESFVQTVIALANTIDARDSYTSDHSERLAKLAIATAQELNCSPEEIEAIHWAMHLHDIGKIATPDEVLQKPGPLNEVEWLMIQKHPEIGANIVAPVKRLKEVAPLIRTHHEKYDGSGYPGGLRKDEIPLGARILTIVDSYGAITDNRVYRKARNHHEAITEIKRCIGKQFDPMVAKAFLAVVEGFHREEILQKGEALGE